MATELTIAEARALECNGCGDCCDSRRSPSPVHWVWDSRSPRDELARMFIIALADVRGRWVELPRNPGAEPFACRMLRPAPDGTASCAVYDVGRPSVCADFPVFFPWLDTLDEPWTVLPEGNLPRCTWADVVIVPTNGAGRGR